MTNDGSNTLAYDGASRVISSTGSASSGAYTYDGNNLRVKKVLGSGSTVYIFSGSKVIAEYDNGAPVASPSREYIYSGSQLLATLSSAGTSTTTTYHHPDHLSVRIDTDGTSGSSTYGQATGQQGHYPFGEQWYDNGNTTKTKFTSYERDPESSNDFAMARFHINRLGRFSSADPFSGSTSNPESLNKYSYALNDPVNLADPFGLDPFAPGTFICFEAEGVEGWVCISFGGRGTFRGPLPMVSSGERGGTGGPKKKAKKRKKCDANVPTDAGTARLAQLVYAEGNGTAVGDLAIASVVVNRANYGNPREFGRGIKGVINKGFAATNDALFNSVSSQAKVSNLSPDDCTRYKNAATAAIAAQVPGGTNTDALFYFDTSVAQPGYLTIGLANGSIIPAPVDGTTFIIGNHDPSNPNGAGIYGNPQIFYQYFDFTH